MGTLIFIARKNDYILKEKSKNKRSLVYRNEYYETSVKNKNKEYKYIDKLKKCCLNNHKECLFSNSSGSKQELEKNKNYRKTRISVIDGAVQDLSLIHI